MQELIVSKIPFFKFLSTSDKPRLDQFTTITASCSASLSESFQPYKEGEIPTPKEKYAVFRAYAKSHRLVKHTKISYAIASLVFRKCLCVKYQNGPNRGTSKRRPSKYRKNAKRVGTILFVRDLVLSGFYEQEAVPQKFICASKKITDHQFSWWVYTRL